MADPIDDGPSPKSEGPLAAATKTADYLQRITGVVGAIITASSTLVGESWALAIGLGLCATSAGWYFLSRRRRSRQRRQAPPLRVESARKAILRGLLPFEKGEALPGRDGDLKRVVAKIASSDFRFGYISGEAGSGKTSFVRAGLLSQDEPGIRLVYSRKPGTNPVASIAKALQEEIGEPFNDGALSLRALLSEAHKKLPTGRLIVVCDQFEEFFIAHRSLASREAFIQDVKICLDDDTIGAGFLFVLRKEFVDDLQDFKAAIPQPLDARFSYRLRNWDTSEALAVLRSAAQHDHVPFAEALQEAVVADLEQDGEVRPVEMQIVASHLIRERAFDIARYQTHGRASGILKSYVQSVIEPAGTNTPELERQVARHLLRCLCAGTSDAKRPSGLKVDELEKHIRASLQKGDLGDLISDLAHFREALTVVVERCRASYLILQEDEETLGLVHDYIVRPILDATRGIEPVEEQANRLLEQYLDQQRRNPRITIAYGDYRFIKKFSDSSRKREGPAARLLVRTRQRRVATIGGICGLCLLVATLVVPPRVRFSAPRTSPPAGAHWHRRGWNGREAG